MTELKPCMTELKPCPNCGCDSVKINKRRGKYQYECNGCWTFTKWYWTETETREAWNNLEVCPLTVEQDGET